MGRPHGGGWWKPSSDPLAGAIRSLPGRSPLAIEVLYFVLLCSFVCFCLFLLASSEGDVHVHGCAVLLCLVCLFDLACFFLSFFLLISHLKTCMRLVQCTMYMHYVHLTCRVVSV